MSEKQVIINGRPYDAVTGLPVSGPLASPVPTPQKKINDVIKKEVTTPQISHDIPVVKKSPASSISHPTTAKDVHVSVQRSQTLNRRIVKKHAPAPPKSVSRAAGRSMDISKSNSVSRFAHHPVNPAQSLHRSDDSVSPIAARQQKAAQIPADHGPLRHPIAERALQRHQVKTVAAAVTRPEPSSIDFKKEAIDMALSTPSPSRKPLKKKKAMWNKHKTLWTSLIIAIAIVVIGGVVVFMNIPALSVAVAGSRAGIAATYPSYTPEGYSLHQPVQYDTGKVVLTFTSNSNQKNYTITEQQTSWDSSALLENVVQKAAGTNYLTTQDSGLTIYNYNNDAAWVNNGLMYTITGASPLSNTQLHDIATSM